MMGRKSEHNLPPGTQLDKHGINWATLVDEDAKLWSKRYPGRIVPCRKAPKMKEAFRLKQQLTADLKATRDPNADNPKVVDWVRTCIGRKRKLAESSRERYNQALVCQIEPFRIGRMRVQEVLKRHVEDWVDELIAQPLRADTI